MAIKKCLNCGKEFIKRNTKTKRNNKYCSSKCYWEHHLKDILKRSEKNVNFRNSNINNTFYSFYCNI